MLAIWIALHTGQRCRGNRAWFEDVDDHHTLRQDPVLAHLSESSTPKRSDCGVLAGKSTLNRVEHGRAREPTRYHKDPLRQGGDGGPVRGSVPGNL